MSQGFTPNTPATNALALSAIVRDNNAALVSSNAGSAVPSYAVAGTLWFDENVQRLKVVKERGSDPYLAVPMGAQIQFFVDLKAYPGYDGAGIACDVRVQDSTLLASDRDWSIVGSPSALLNVYFNINYSPAYFAATKWNDALIGEPVLWTGDGKLLGKNWESLAPSTHETLYTSVASPVTVMENVIPFENDSLRAFELEIAGVEANAEITLAGGIDHTLVDLGSYAAWEWHDLVGNVKLYENGVLRTEASFKLCRLYYAGSVYAVIYNIDPLTGSLTPFAATSRFLLSIRKSS